MKFLNFNKVLCLSPHPDDIELGMLGTIIKHTDTIFDVLVMTKGCGSKENDFDETNKSNRLLEVENAWKSSKCKNVQIKFSDCNYFDDKKGNPDWIKYLDEIVANSKYEGIFIPPNDDSMFEHRFVNNLGSSLIRAKAISLIEYHTVSTLNTWIPNLFVNIEENYNTKLDALKQFESQLSKSYFQKSTLDSFHSNFQCSKKELNVVEKFKIIEMFEGIS